MFRIQIQQLQRKKGLERAHDYLDFTAYSYKRLIEQLEYEVFQQRKLYMQPVIVVLIGLNRL